MDLYKLNDYELIYLFRDGNEVALNLLFKKYEAFIQSKLNTFKVTGALREDFYSEALMALYAAITSYNDNIRITFYNYFNIVLTRRFVKAYAKLVRPEIPVENIDWFLGEENIEYRPSLYEDGLALMKTDCERLVYRELYKVGLSPGEIATNNNIDIKKVYNTINKIKERLKVIKY